MDSPDLQSLRTALADPTWHGLSSADTADTIEKLQSHYEKELSKEAAQARLAAFGPNELQEASPRVS